MVIDSSAAFDLLERTAAGAVVGAAIAHEATLAAPDVLVFEVVAGFRRQVQRRKVSVPVAERAIGKLGVLPIEFFPTLGLRHRAWELRHNFTAGDAMFVALAELLAEPLLTTDRGLAKAARKHLAIEVIVPSPN